MPNGQSPHSRHIGNHYLERAVSDPEQLVRNFRSIYGITSHSSGFAPGEWDFDTLVGTGISGAVVVPLMAHLLQKDWLIVRKPNDGSHSNYPVEGFLGRRWLFVDDLIASGRTFERAFNAVQDVAAAYHHDTEFVGYYLYNQGHLQHAKHSRFADRLARTGTTQPTDPAPRTVFSNRADG